MVLCRWRWRGWAGLEEGELRAVTTGARTPDRKCRGAEVNFFPPHQCGATHCKRGPARLAPASAETLRLARGGEAAHFWTARACEAGVGAGQQRVFTRWTAQNGLYGATESSKRSRGPRSEGETRSRHRRARRRRGEAVRSGCAAWKRPAASASPSESRSGAARGREQWASDHGDRGPNLAQDAPPTRRSSLPFSSSTRLPRLCALLVLASALVLTCVLQRLACYNRICVLPAPRSGQPRPSTQDPRSAACPASHGARDSSATYAGSAAAPLRALDAPSLPDCALRWRIELCRAHACHGDRSKRRADDVGARLRCQARLLAPAALQALCVEQSSAP